MSSFIALIPIVLFLSLILYAVIDSDRVDQAQQRALDRWEAEEASVRSTSRTPRRRRAA